MDRRSVIAGIKWELLSLAIDQNIATIPWSQLGWGRLTGKVRRNQPLPEVSRLHKTREIGPPIPDERVYDIVEAMDEIAKETGKTVPQIALNWLLHRPTVASVIVGACNEEQLRQNLGAIQDNPAAAGTGDKWKACLAVSSVTGYLSSVENELTCLPKKKTVSDHGPVWSLGVFENQRPPI